jgi:hypothetical protein
MFWKTLLYQVMARRLDHLAAAWMLELYMNLNSTDIFQTTNPLHRFDRYGANQIHVATT